MTKEKKGKPKKKIGERARSILTETSGNANDRSQIMAQIDEVHDTKADKPMAKEKEAIIPTETVVNAKDSSMTMAQIEEVHDTRVDEPMAGEKTGNQGAKWPEMMMGMWNNVPAFTTSNKAMEPFIELTKVQQQQCLNMSRAWIDHLWKMGDASRSGDVKKVWETCMESNKDLLTACQESMKEQATARHELWRTFIFSMPGFTGDRT